MTTALTIDPAHRVPFAAVEQVLTGVGPSNHCWCRWWLTPNAEYADLDDAGRRSALRDDLATQTPRGLLARVGDEPVGWVGVAPRADYARLARTKALAGATPDTDFSDPSIWAVVCVTVAAAHRGTDIARALLDAALTHARNAGAERIEAYPIDTTVSAARRSPTDLNTGTMTLFLSAGFTEVGRTKADRPVMQCSL